MGEKDAGDSEIGRTEKCESRARSNLSRLQSRISKTITSMASTSGVVVFAIGTTRNLTSQFKRYRDDAKRTTSGDDL